MNKVMFEVMRYLYVYKVQCTSINIKYKYSNS